MPISVLKDCHYYLAGYDLSGDHNEHSLTIEQNNPEATPFNVSSRVRVPGLRNIVSRHHGFSQSATGPPLGVDDVQFAHVGAAQKICSIFPTAMALGDIGYGFQALFAKYRAFGKIGEVFDFDVDAEGSGPGVRETLMEYGAKTATGNGTTRLLTAVSAAQKVYSFLHVLAITGTGSPSIQVIIESDDNVGMTTPTTRITHTTFNVIGGELMSLIGPITDTYWRARWVVTGTSPSLTILVGLGIQ